MKTATDRVQLPYVPSDFETEQIFGARNNYLPGNGILRDVTRIPKRRLLLHVRQLRKIWHSFVRYRGFGLPEYLMGIPFFRPRPGQQHHSCTSCIKRQQFLVPIRTLCFLLFRAVGCGGRTAHNKTVTNVYPVSNIPYRALYRFLQCKDLSKNLIVIKALQMDRARSAGCHT
jgi:hypothetical protein